MRKALNSASQQRKASRSLRSQAIERTLSAVAESLETESVAEEGVGGGAKRSEKRSEICFWKNSRSSRSCSWLPSIETT